MVCHLPGFLLKADALLAESLSTCPPSPSCAVETFKQTNESSQNLTLTESIFSCIHHKKGLWSLREGPVLQDCFEHTDLDMFRDAVTGSVLMTLRSPGSSPHARVRGHEWLNLLHLQDIAFKSGNDVALRAGIRAAKRTHAQKIHGHCQNM